MAFADSQGCRIYYRLEGSPERPLFVLAHALGTDHGLWQPQMSTLLRYFRVLRLDLRGHGASDSPAGEYTMAQLGQDVLAAVDHAGAGRFSYCGLSLGGMIGQWLGAHHAAQLDRLVLANTSPRMADPSLFDTRRRLVQAEGMRAVEASAMQRFFSSPTHAAADSVRAVLLANNVVGYSGCCSAIRDMDHRDLLARIGVPTLVIGGDRDLSAPWAGHGDLLAAAIPGARAAKIDAAHLSNVERPAAFNRALTGFAVPPSPDALENGFVIRRSVLGDAHVDKAIANTTAFTRDFQDLITRYAWGTIWARPGLDPRTRRLLVLATTAALGRWEEFRLHVRTGLAGGGLELEDLEEVLLQAAVYAGVPAANTGFQVVMEETQP
jgi:3-oxoadipate enol-lactonase / 4-carboxymuconolactone decarboxylase